MFSNSRRARFSDTSPSKWRDRILGCVCGTVSQAPGSHSLLAHDLRTVLAVKGGFAAPWRRALDRSGPFGENSSAKREWLRMNRPRPRNLRTDHELPEPNLRKFWRESCDVTSCSCSHNSVSPRPSRDGLPIGACWTAATSASTEVVPTLFRPSL
jgi:hypothetical protein